MAFFIGDFRYNGSGVNLANRFALCGLNNSLFPEASQTPVIPESTSNTRHPGKHEVLIRDLPGLPVMIQKMYQVSQTAKKIKDNRCAVSGMTEK